METRTTCISCTRRWRHVHVHRVVNHFKATYISNDFTCKSINISNMLNLHCIAITHCIIECAMSIPSFSIYLLLPELREQSHCSLLGPPLVVFLSLPGYSLTVYFTLLDEGKGGREGEREGGREEGKEGRKRERE